MNRTRVVIVGGGFGGLAAARALAGVNAEVTLIDRRNHHLFQPLLYQVATAALSPADIAAPIRQILRRQENCRVVLGEVHSVDIKNNRLLCENTWFHYDYLVLACGVTHSYFGKTEWEERAPGLKSVEDATEIRRRILLAFEEAEYEGSEEARKAALTFAIVGGGPTGVELAGAIKEIAAQTIPRDFRNIDTRTTRVILFEAGERVLSTFHPNLSAKAQSDLEALGVEVRTSQPVSNITLEGLQVGDEFIPVRNIFWAAGVQAGPLTRSLGVQLDRAGRVLVNPDLTIPGQGNVFVIGDMAAAVSAKTKKPVPGVAPAALQAGRYVGKLLRRELSGRSSQDQRTPFSYIDKGALATIGRARAVAEIRGLRLSGLFAWLLWSVVHVLYLVGFRNRIVVALNWLWNWLVFSRGARLITGQTELNLEKVKKTAGTYPRPTKSKAEDAKSRNHPALASG